MNPPFELPMDHFLSGKFSLKNPPLPPGFLGTDLDALDLEPEREEELQAAEMAMGVALLLLRQSEKIRSWMAFGH